MALTQRPLSGEEAVSPDATEPGVDVRAWQDAKIQAGLRAADEGRFASQDAVRAVIRKYIPNG